MSGNPAALRDMIANMTHGGRIAMLGLPAAEFAVDWATVVTSMLTIKGIYGREMFETWYNMSVLRRRGSTSPGDHRPVPLPRLRRAAFDTAASGARGKVILDGWSA